MHVRSTRSRLAAAERSNRSIAWRLTLRGRAAPPETGTRLSLVRQKKETRIALRHLGWRITRADSGLHDADEADASAEAEKEYAL
ncbi:MAG: hypothetical protein JWM53_3994 [bacterium]|nr:hypothetical protein [bacterium]